MLNEQKVDNSSKDTKSYFNTTPAKIWGGILLFSLICKFLQWPVGTILFLISSSGLIAYAFTEFIKLEGKSDINNLICLIGVFWLGFLIYDWIFEVFSIYGNNGYIMSFVVFYTFLAYYNLLRKIEEKIRKEKFKTSKLSFLLNTRNTMSTWFIFFASHTLLLFTIKYLPTEENKLIDKSESVPESVEQDLTKYYLMCDTTFKMYSVGDKYRNKVFLNDNSLYSKYGVKPLFYLKNEDFIDTNAKYEPIFTIGDTGYVEFVIKDDLIKEGTEEIRSWKAIIVIPLPEKDTVFALQQDFVYKK